MKRFIAILALVCFATLIIFATQNALAQTSAIPPVSKDGITVKVLYNTDFCDTDCQTDYEVCMNPLATKSVAEDAAIMFYDKKGAQITAYGSQVKTASVTVGKTFLNFSATRQCKKVTVAGTKGFFESVDNVPCFDKTCFNDFAWWNTSCSNRSRIIANATFANVAFSVNDTFGINGQLLWTNNRTEPIYVYYCPDKPRIGNETDEIPWEASATRTGYNPTSVFSSAYIAYHLDEGTGTSVYSSSATVSTATVTGIEGWNNSGLFGKAFTFNRTNFRKIQTQDITAQFEGVKNYSIEVWAMPFTIPSIDPYLFMCSDAGDNNHDLRFGTSTGKNLSVLTYEFGYGNVVGNFNLASNLNKWNHFVLTVASNANATIYANGGQYGTGTIQAITGMDRCYIGSGTYDNADQAWNGTIDEVRIYNRTLSASEILDHYNNGINKLSSMGANESVPFINFVFTIKDSFTSDDLTSVTVACRNVHQPSDFFSVTVNSPYAHTFLNVTDYACNVSKSGYYNFSFTISLPTDIAALIYMDRVGGLSPSEKQKLDQVYFLQSVNALPEELVISNQSCLDANTLSTSYNPVYCSNPSSCSDVLTVCPYGCDPVTTQCRGDPIQTVAFFIGFLLYLAVIIIIPILVFTHHSNKRRRDAVIHFLIFTFSVMVYTITTVYLVPAVAVFFGNDYYFIAILAGIVLIVFPLINILFIFNNIMKGRY